MVALKSLLLSTLLLVLRVESITGNPLRNDNGSFALHIVHTNDMHARFEQTSQLSAACTEKSAASGSCYGGFARIATVIREARKSSTPTIFLNAGDTYQGSVWFNVYKWKIVAKFLNLLNPDAISLGNHEFDDGVSGLVPFINNVSFPVLAANLNLTFEPELAATKLSKSTVLTVNGTKIGVIGYLTPDTKTIASTGNVIFRDEVEAVAEEAKRLKDEGVNILIALGHSGFEMDKKIAEEVEYIDLVIGGNRPDSEVPEGLYPTEITQHSGRKVYVVQAYAYTKYVGNLSLIFDSDGELTNITGNPVLVDNSIEQAEDILGELNIWRAAIDNLTDTVVGATRVLLNGDSKTCRREECNLGNLITDAMVDYQQRQYVGDDGWTDSPIAILNSGGIRTSITRENNDQITMADVLAVLPFENAVLSVTLPGSILLDILEWSVHDLDITSTSDLNGAFLQYSGIQVKYDLSKPSSSRVVSAKVLCGACRIPTYSDLNVTASYNVLMSDFMYNGGDGYSMITGYDYSTIGETLATILSDYLTRRGVVYPTVEWRITYENSVAGSSSNNLSYSIAMLLLPLLGLRFA